MKPEIILPPMKKIRENSPSQIQIQHKIEEIAGGPVTWGFEGNLELFRKDLGKKKWEDIGSTVKQYCSAIRDMYLLFHEIFFVNFL